MCVRCVHCAHVRARGGGGGDDGGGVRSTRSAAVSFDGQNHQPKKHTQKNTHKTKTNRYNPIKTIKTSFIGTMNMLGLAKRTRARFLITSTSEVYGDPLEHPQTESYWGNVNPIGERSCYDEGKRAAETLTMDYYREHGLEVRIVRIFNTYGPRMALDDGRVVSNFVAQALTDAPITVRRCWGWLVFGACGDGVALRCGALCWRGSGGTSPSSPKLPPPLSPPLPSTKPHKTKPNQTNKTLQNPKKVYGDGQQTRSFQYVADLIAGMVAVMDGDEIGPFNVGNPNEFTMLELANVVKEVRCLVVLLLLL